VEELPDGELATRIAAGVREAERELCRRFAPRIRLWGRRHVREDAAVEDLVQDSLVTVLESLREGKLREPSLLASFVLGTCRTLSIDAARTRRRRSTLLEAFAAELVPSPADGPLLDRDRLRNCVEALAERERAVVVATFFADQEAVEIAADLGLTAGNLRVVRHRALARLHECMEGGVP
jgi:RNA polymerase sigma-70 factor (ECF subfamily)